MWTQVYIRKQNYLVNISSSLPIFWRYFQSPENGADTALLTKFRNMIVWGIPIKCRKYRVSVQQEFWEQLTCNLMDSRRQMLNMTTLWNMHFWCIVVDNILLWQPQQHTQHLRSYDLKHTIQPLYTQEFLLRKWPEKWEG